MVSTLGEISSEVSTAICMARRVTVGLPAAALCLNFLRVGKRRSSIVLAANQTELSRNREWFETKRGTFMEQLVAVVLRITGLCTK